MQPDVKVTYAPARKYWFVRLICHDRNKLLFDLVCTFVDLDFDIFHATMDAEEVAGMQKATMEFYVRPRLGGPDYDPVKGRRLAEMLRASILRRLPKGLKLHVQTHEVRLRHALLQRDVRIKPAAHAAQPPGLADGAVAARAWQGAPGLACSGATCV